MRGEAFLLASLAACGIGAVAAPFAGRHAGRVLVAAVVVAGLAALGAAATAAGGRTVVLALWDLATLGRLSLALDPLGALFLVVSAIVFVAGAPYAAREARSLTGRGPGWLAAGYLLLLAAIEIVLAAGDVLTFLIAWETMSLLLYALLGFGAEREGRTRAAYLMVAMSEAGMVAGAIGLLLLATSAGGADFAALREAAGPAPGEARAAFLLCFFGFGVKAGLAPVNQWLPEAYAAAPRGIAPVIAGATTNLGVYAILRVVLDLAPAGSGEGLVVLATGSVTALVGILYATIQADLRRLLAHSSIENMGIVVAVAGAGMVFAASGYPVPAAIALVAGLYHLVNHSLYKTLLFLGAGSVEAAAGTRDLDRLGGLVRRMPVTTGLVLVGVLAVAGLPPLNGFASEWLVLQSLLRAAELPQVGPKVVFALSGAALALTAGLAVTCFVKLFAMGFLGVARSPGVDRAREAPGVARGPMAALAVACLALGVLPTYVVPALDRIAAPLAGASAAEALVPDFFHARPGDLRGLSPDLVAELHDLGAGIGRERIPGRGLVVLHRGGAANPVVFAMSTTYMAAVLLALLALANALLRVAVHRRAVRRAPSWAGGLRRLEPGFTYTATGFSNPVRVVFDAVLRPTTREDTTRAVAEHFRTAVRRERAEVHVVERWCIRPVVAAIRRAAGLVRGMHHGRVNAYAAYVLLALLVVLAVGMAAGAADPARGRSGETPSHLGGTAP